jgi:hypothetical protein
MRVLFDECLPTRKLRPVFHGYDVVSVQEMGWHSITNGKLLALAEPHFDAFITVDSNLRYQQNTPNVDLLIVVLRASSNRLEDLLPLVTGAVGALRTDQRGEVIEVSVS